ncbi:hypothetical protein [Luteibacter sp.]|uniref:hypothetical protein n=1 Tax=Luteibacter sp. TaxID=1886636 RepID=UPI002807C5D1|nr:hypothetical protein [Luteibacter sp.]MDQ8050986.1 hypothetical protein [Luteibacter sp.]
MIGLDTPKRITRHGGQQHMVDQRDQTLYWNRFPDRPSVVSQEGNDGVGKDVELFLSSGSWPVSADRVASSCSSVRTYTRNLSVSV